MACLLNAHLVTLHEASQENGQGNTMVATVSTGQTHDVLQVLAEKLLAADTSLPEKYRILFSLRNLPGEQARSLLSHGEAPQSSVCIALRL
jgi:hypothetical protein